MQYVVLQISHYFTVFARNLQFLMLTELEGLEMVDCMMIGTSMVSDAFNTQALTGSTIIQTCGKSSADLLEMDQVGITFNRVAVQLERGTAGRLIYR